MDTKGKSYILNCILDLTFIYNEFVKLLSHPKQRAIEIEADYNIKNLIKITGSNQDTSSPSTSNTALEKTINMEKD